MGVRRQVSRLALLRVLNSKPEGKVPNFNGEMDMHLFLNATISQNRLKIDTYCEI